MGELAPKSVQSIVSLPPSASTPPPSIPVLEQVVPHVSSSSGIEANPAPSNRPLRPPRTVQPPMMPIVPTTAPSVAKGKALILSKSMTWPPFELPIMADIPRPSHYEKMKRSSRVSLS
ncbi:classical arabinogalactan protein 9-like [Cryptomeria japonica]|uniref:classical arabinogalactan protein 9-like n=1 Tax=Cryptomeria japonica TaxID=3369 RepID=UPI0025AC7DB8|nr:classical arabinogalactan protein 9-like [Cryptomeria japonica]